MKLSNAVELKIKIYHRYAMWKWFFVMQLRVPNGSLVMAMLGNDGGGGDGIHLWNVSSVDIIQCFFCVCAKTISILE